MSNPTDELIRQLDSVRRYNSEQCEQYNKVVAQRDALYKSLKNLKALLKDDSKLHMQIHTIGDEFEAYKIFADCDDALAKVEENKNE